MRLTGLAGRIAYAVLAGVVTFIIVFIIGVFATSFSAEVGALLKQYAALIGFLVGLVYFFLRPVPPVA